METYLEQNGVIDFFMAKVARLAGISHQIVLKVKKIKEAAATDPESAAARDKMWRGESSGNESSIEELYQLVVRKESARLENQSGKAT